MAFEEGSMVMLTDDSQLRKLADILQKQEEPRGDAIDSEVDRAKYIKECNDAYNKVTVLLNKCNDLDLTPKVTHDYLKHVIDTIMDHVRKWCLSKKWDGLLQELSHELDYAYHKFINLRRLYNDVIHGTKQTSDISKAEIVKDIQDYVKYAVNVSLQCVQDCRLRKRWISKIEAHFETLVHELEHLNVRSEADVQSMVEDVSLYKQCMLEYASIYGSGFGRVNSEAYLMLLKKEQKKFLNAAQRKMDELGFSGEFDRLTESQQLEVCHGMINESGGAQKPNFELAEHGYEYEYEYKHEHEYGLKCIASHILFAELIFGNVILDLTGSSYHTDQMPDGMALAYNIAYSNP